MNWIQKKNEWNAQQTHQQHQQLNQKRWIDDVETKINEIFSTKCKCALHTTITIAIAITTAIDWFVSYGSMYSTRQPCWRRPQKTNRTITVWHSINQNNLFLFCSYFHSLLFPFFWLTGRLENIDRYLKISAWYFFLLLILF